MSPNLQRNIGLLQIGFADAIGSNGVEGLVGRLKAFRYGEHAATCIRPCHFDALRKRCSSPSSLLVSS